MAIEEVLAQCRDCKRATVYLDSLERVPSYHLDLHEEGCKAPIALWINVYDVNQRYGGPEEGGWYWNEFHPVVSYGPYPPEAEADVKDIQSSVLLAKSLVRQYSEVYIEHEFQASETQDVPLYC